jgi:peptidoglycan-N-acetylglucosamine deacetylase
MLHHILLTIDVEDWFQVENFKPWIPYSLWESCELRVERNTHRILDLLDGASCQRSAIGVQLSRQPASGFQNPASTETPAFDSNPQQATCNMQLVSDNGQPATRNLRTKNPPKATFFVLGWLAERLPHLVREIHARGHEVASHGYDHELCLQSSGEKLKEDLAKSKKLLEEIIGSPVHGYRAPSFSISDDILKKIAEAGYEYDSSYNCFPIHGRYGRISLNGKSRSGIAYQIFEGFFELPVSNLKLKKPFSSRLAALSSEQNSSCFVLPWGGGAYFRLIPSWFFLKGVHSILEKDSAYLFYVHPWEVDPGQPRPKGLPFFSRFKHYTNLSTTHQRLESLIKTFSGCQFLTCAQYLELS